MTDTILTQIQNVIDSRRGGDPDASYVAQLLHKGEDKILNLGKDGIGHGQFLLFSFRRP